MISSFASNDLTSSEREIARRFFHHRFIFGCNLLCSQSAYCADANVSIASPITTTCRLLALKYAANVNQIALS